MEDSAIIALYWQRNESAIAVTAEKYGGYCGHIAQGILPSREDVEECLSDTWLGAWNAMPPHRPGRLALFLGKITRSLAFDRYRAATAQKRGGGQLPLALEELTACVPTVPGADRAVEDRELTRLLDQFLRSLPPRDSSIFLRRYWYAEPLADIARRYGMKPNTVKTCLYRSREKLRRYLEKEGIAL